MIDTSLLKQHSQANMVLLTKLICLATLHCAILYMQQLLRMLFITVCLQLAINCLLGVEYVTYACLKYYNYGM